MRCNTLKNSRYKSTLETYNNVSQTLGATSAALNILGVVITDTGVSMDNDQTSIEIESSGTYEINAEIGVNVTTAGVLTFQMYDNGNALPETLKTITCAAGNSLVNLGTIRFFQTCCRSNPTLQIRANTDGTAVGTVTSIMVNAQKLA